ncbi:MAG: MaoC family dehydratase [Burkholderiaceae bacterium]
MTLPIAPGHRFSRTFQFTPEEVKRFSLAAGDTNPLHLDEAFAAKSLYGRLIASGTHSSSILLGLTASHFSEYHAVVGVTFTVNFKRAVYADELVHVEWTVQAMKPHRSGTSHFVEMTGALRDGAGQDCVTATGTVLVTFSTQETP